MRIKANVDLTNKTTNSATIGEGHNFKVSSSFRSVSKAVKQALLVNHRFIG